MHKLTQIIVLVSIWASLSPAQGTDHSHEVGSIRFEGNKELNSSQLLNVIRTRETPWAVQKWIYNRFDKEILFGRKPEYFDPVTFASDYQQLKKLYEENGFFHVQVDTSINAHLDEGKVFLTFSIIEGRRSLIDTILFHGLENLSPDVQKELLLNKQITLGMPYIQTMVEAEYTRVVHLCANNGYVNVRLVTLEVRRYASTDNVSIVFVFNLGKRFTFGNISVEQDTTSHQHIDSSIVLEHLEFSKGEYYGEEKKIESERYLNRLGIFETAKIENAIPTISSDTNQIPIKVLIRTRSFQELTPEIGVNDENNALNVLLGVGYNHHNFLGGAENFSTNLRLNVQSIHFGTIFNGDALRDSSLISKIEWAIQLVWPYFINNKTSISTALSAMLDKQLTYYIPSINYRLGTLSQTATYTKLFVDWNLQLSNPKTLAAQPDSSLQQFFKDQGFEQQFNSFVAVTLQRDKRNDLFYPSDGIFQSITFEEGGLIPRVFDVSLPYAQYVKLILDGQWYWDPNNKRELIWATRLRTGGALLYDHSPLKDIPLTQRFYSGGSGSVRGWMARDLGAVPDRKLGGDAMLEGTIEARLNLLKNAGSLGFLDLAKLSFVLFCDGGNIWTTPQRMRLSEVAMAFGFGLRYNTIAGPIRIDFGMKMYDPSDGSWVTDKRFIQETVSKGVIHLGVGHTF